MHVFAFSILFPYVSIRQYCARLYGKLHRAHYSRNTGSKIQEWKRYERVWVREREREWTRPTGYPRIPGLPRENLRAAQFAYPMLCLCGTLIYFSRSSRVENGPELAGVPSSRVQIFNFYRVECELPDGYDVQESSTWCVLIQMWRIR